MEMLLDVREGNIEDVLRLAEYLFGYRQAEDESLISRALVGIAPAQLPALEEAIRQIWRGGRREPPFVQRALSGAVNEPALFRLISFHPDGHVREAAVARLASSEDGSELPFLLLRCDDWVPQVRSAAERAVMPRLRDENAAAVTRNFSLIARLALRGRAEELLAKVAAAVVSPSYLRALSEVIAAGPREEARAIVGFVINRVGEAMPPIVAAGVVSRDDLVRRLVAPFVTSPETLELLVRDAVPAVRRAALETLARTSSDRARPHLERALLDGSAAVRETARVRLADAQLDFAAIYRQALSSPTSRKIAAALAGLAETGRADDAALAEPFLVHTSAAVRRAAMRCVLSLDGNAFAERIAPMLLDASRSVSASARDRLRKHVITIGAQSLQELFERAPSQHARLNVIRLMPLLSRWQAIGLLVAATTSNDAPVADEARKFVRSWRRNYGSQSVPSRQDLARLASALDAAEGSLDRESLADIRFSLQPFLRSS